MYITAPFVVLCVISILSSFALSFDRHVMRGERTGERSQQGVRNSSLSLSLLLTTTSTPSSLYHTAQQHARLFCCSLLFRRASRPRGEQAINNSTSSTTRSPLHQHHQTHSTIEAACHLRNLSSPLAIIQVRLRPSQQPSPQRHARVPHLAHLPSLPHHTGVTVVDLERSLSFWTDIIGLKLVERSHPIGAEPGAISGVGPYAEIKIAKVEAPNGYVIE